MASNLANDIIAVLGGRNPPVAHVVKKPELWAGAALNMANHLATPLKPAKETGPTRLKEKILWASELGEGCDRKLWYKFNTPGVSEPLDGAAKFKFSYGHLIEEAALVYAQAAGYQVDNQQYLLAETLPNGWLVRGRIDASVTSGFLAEKRIIDVKSCSTAAFAKYSLGGDRLRASADSFGYIQQLYFYDNNANQLPDYAAESWKEAEFLLIDKQLGRMKSMSYSVPDAVAYRYQVMKGSEIWAAAMEAPVPPRRAYNDVPDGASGNHRLGVECSYCPFKTTCWDGLRAFSYSTGPKFLTVVRKPPGVIEIPLATAEVPTLATAA